MTNEVSKQIVVAVVQARSSSRRFPNKALQPILGKPMLIHQLERIRRCQSINKLIVATSDHTSDNRLAKICVEFGYTVKRGSLRNVVRRFQTTLEDENYDQLVRLTGDCPLVDPDVIEQVICEHIKYAADYTTNALIPSFPDGLDVEVLRKTTFDNVLQNAYSSSQLEHVTPYIYENQHIFKIHNVTSAIDLSSYRWTVDEPVDLQLVRQIYESLYPSNPNFSMCDILNLIRIRSSELAQNSHISRNEGYTKSEKKL